MTKLKICLAGATGWAGSALCRGIAASDDLEIVSAVSQYNATKDLSTILNLGIAPIPIFATAYYATDETYDVFVEYTNPSIAKSNILIALRKGLNVVVGTSGLTNEDYQEIEQAALKHQKGVLAVGNFAITAVLLQKFAEMAAKYIPNWELIDYASSTKADAPSGTVRELAHRLGKIGESKLAVPLDAVNGPDGIRGARMDGTQIHAVRLPGHVIGVEALFGMPDQRLSIRHDAGSSAEPYVQGALLAIRKVGTFIGLKRGLDQVMDF